MQQTLELPSPALAVPRIDLSPADTRSVAALALEYVRASGSLTPARALRLAAVMAHELPRPLRRALTDYRLTGGPHAGLLISGLPVDEGAIGPTPSTYEEQPGGTELRCVDAVLHLTGSLLGEPLAFRSRQGGRLVLDLYPVAGQEHARFGPDSRTALDWHTEDAFHPYRPDWTMLLGLRNPDRIATTFAVLDDIRLRPEHRRTLFQKRFHVLPDGACAPPEPVALLEGDPRAPWLRVDPPSLLPRAADPTAAAAMHALLTSIEEHLVDVCVGAGEALVLDNGRAVHGRRPFAPRYDGTDCWFKRLNLTADLRRSAGQRGGEHGRAVA